MPAFCIRHFETAQQGVNLAPMIRRTTTERCMLCRTSLIISALTMGLSMTIANAHDESKYPNWKGQWSVILVPGLGGQAVKFDPTKPWGKGQEAPLTPEYQKIHEES